MSLFYPGVPEFCIVTAGIPQLGNNCCVVHTTAGLMNLTRQQIMNEAACLLLLRAVRMRVKPGTAAYVRHSDDLNWQNWYIVFCGYIVFVWVDCICVGISYLGRYIVFG
jgi:hypothetical protein